jgi:two-component system LytT family sensor kinase
MDRLTDFTAIRYLSGQQTTRQRLQYHAVFWAIFIAFHLLYFAASCEKILSSQHWAAAYGLYYLRFIPVFYLSVGIFSGLKRKYSESNLIVITIAGMVVIMHLLTAWVYYLLDYLYGLPQLSDAFKLFGAMYLQSPARNTISEWILLLVYDIQELQLLFLPLGLKMVKYGLRGEFAKRELQSEKLKNELHTLKSQSAPHFVLNAINAAYSQVQPVCNQSAEYLEDLGSVLHYALHETSDDLVLIYSEWQALLNYVRLESKRFDNLTISINMEGNVHQHKFIPALMLFTLTENAFKHGVYPTSDPCQIDISLLITETELSYTIANSLSAQPYKPRQAKRAGIGLENIRKRLEHSFPNRHSFSVEKSAERFTAQVRIPILTYEQIPLKVPFRS